jgi:predicted RNA-binding protein YlxR (DUF448 family)
MEKKIPLRTCIACRTCKPKKELIRVVKFGEEISLDKTGKKNGRGAYVCDSADCIAKLKRQKLLNKVFNCPVEDSVYDKITEEFFGKQE